MSDFEERLSAVLAGQADDAPQGGGLAEAARRRHGVRRRRQLAVGAVAVVLAITAPVAVLAGGGGDGARDELVGNDGTSTAPTGEWQTVEDGDVWVAIPGDWGRFSCDFDGFESEVFGPTEVDACDFRTYLAFYGSATFDPFAGPGVISANEDADDPGWSGYVYAGDLAVTSSTGDRELTRRILASARVAGQPEVDGSEWRTVEDLGIRVDIPEFWGLGAEADLELYAVCVAPGERDDPPELQPKADVDEVGVGLSYVSGRWVSVSAPTQALGDLVMATVEATAASSAIGCVRDDFGDGLSGAEPAFPCDPGFGAPKPRAGCPDPAPDLGWLSRGSGGQLVLQPFRTLHNDAEGEAYAQENGLEYPFSNDYLDVPAGAPAAFDPLSAQVCTGAIAIRAGHRGPLEDHVVDCADFGAALTRRDSRIPVAVWRDDGVVVQLSELYRP